MIPRYSNRWERNLLDVNPGVCNVVSYDDLFWHLILYHCEWQYRQCHQLIIRKKESNNTEALLSNSSPASIHPYQSHRVAYQMTQIRWEMVKWWMHHESMDSLSNWSPEKLRYHDYMKNDINKGIPQLSILLLLWMTIIRLVVVRSFLDQWAYLGR